MSNKKEEFNHIAFLEDMPYNDLKNPKLFCAFCGGDELLIKHYDKFICIRCINAIINKNNFFIID